MGLAAHAGRLLYTTHALRRRAYNGSTAVDASPLSTLYTVRGASVTDDNVNHPPHYKTGGIETIDFIEAKQLPYHLGNVVKYVTRAAHKGSELEDLKKAQWYLNRHIQQREAAGGAR